MGYLETLLQDRVNCFEIDSELMIRKWLENTTDYHYEFQKNDDKYGYDIICNRYDINGGEWSKNDLGFIEVELSQKWDDGYPANWKTYSFLARKLLTFDNGQFTMTAKSGADKMLYVIFNRKMTDCIAAKPTELLDAGADLVNTKLTGRNYTDFVLRVPLNCPVVARGREQVARRVELFLAGQ